MAIKISVKRISRRKFYMSEDVNRFNNFNDKL